MPHATVRFVVRVWIYRKNPSKPAGKFIAGRTTIRRFRATSSTSFSDASGIIVNLEPQQVVGLKPREPRHSIIWRLLRIRGEAVDEQRSYICVGCVWEEGAHVWFSFHMPGSVPSTNTSFLDDCVVASKYPTP